MESHNKWGEISISEHEHASSFGFEGAVELQVLVEFCDPAVELDVDLVGNCPFVEAVFEGAHVLLAGVVHLDPHFVLPHVDLVLLNGVAHHHQLLLCLVLEKGLDVVIGQF